MTVLEMLFDWFVREGNMVFAWWLLVTLAGVAVLPLCLRLLRGLPDRGYSLARAAGMLLVGLVFWFLASTGFLRNDNSSMMISWVMVLCGSLLFYFRPGADRIDLRAYWRENSRLIILTEVLFVVLFVGWAIFRAYQNDTFSTEKPMEMTFISGIMRSDTFPPNDAWLSGFAISYYYFGYVMAAMLSMLSGVSSGAGFSLMNALLFALTGVTVLGVGYNLVRSRAYRIVTNAHFFHDDAEPDRILRDSAQSQTPALLTGMLAMIFVIFLSNYQLPLIELPYQSGIVTDAYLDIWNTQGRFDAPVVEPQNSLTGPADWDRWWWFRASRVLTDFNLDGNPSAIQPINEFPQFSFLLSDNHPHVLALPFVMLSLGLSLNLLLTWRNPNRYEIVFYGVTIGGLIFLNTWDGPIHLAILLGADALRRMIRNGTARLHGGDIVSLVLFACAVLLVAVLTYLPFFVGFRSQAAGIVPNLIYPTAIQRYFLMFGPLLLPLLAFVLIEITRGRQTRRLNWSTGMMATIALLLVLLIFTLFLIIAGSLMPSLRGFIQGFVEQNGGWGIVLPQVLERRMAHVIMPLLALILVFLVVTRLFARTGKDKTSDPHDEVTDTITYSPATGFALMLIGAGAVLSLIPEFFYLRDNFGVRINTIFKFYYQTWVFFSLAAAYGVYSILADQRYRVLLPARLIFGIVLIIAVLLPGLLYPVAGVYSRMFVEPMQFLGTGYPIVSLTDVSTEDVTRLRDDDGLFVREGDTILWDGTEPTLIAPEDGMLRVVGNALYLVPAPTLDGRQWMIDADDYAVLQCLSDLVPGDDAVVLEAVRDSYNAQYGRVGAITGIPNLLGWDNHQRQWRGPSYAETVGTRVADVEEIYTDLRFDVVANLIEQYSIDYIVFGTTERDQYGSIAEEKFLDHLTIVCQSGRSRIFSVNSDNLASSLELE